MWGGKSSRFLILYTTEYVKFAEEGQTAWIWGAEKWSEILRVLPQPQPWCIFPSLGKAQGNRDQLQSRAELTELTQLGQLSICQVPGGSSCLQGWERTPGLGDVMSGELTTSRTWKELLRKWLCSLFQASMW